MCVCRCRLSTTGGTPSSRLACHLSVKVAHHLYALPSPSARHSTSPMFRPAVWSDTGRKAGARGVDNARAAKR